MITPDRLQKILAAIESLQVGVIGDFALDLYYEYTADTGAHSLETGKAVHYGRLVRTSPGAAGNVVSNLAALRPRRIEAFGVIGDDLFGRELRYRLEQLGVDPAGLHVQPEGWISQTYIKPLLDLEEQNRLDFGEYNQVSPASHEALLARLERLLPELDVLVVNQQFAAPLLTPEFAARLNALVAHRPELLVVADCRQTAHLLRGAVWKLNASEAARLLGRPIFDESSSAACREHGAAVRQLLGGPVLLTRGENGLLVFPEVESCLEVPGLFILGETDPVGAGDTCIAAFGASRGAGASWQEAAEIANLAAGVTVRKLKCTGTATPEELRQAHATAEFVYRPDLAADPRLAVYFAGSRIEVVNESAKRPIQHVILDHDGTISTLRQGWETVMFEVAMDAIAGERLATLSLAAWDKLAAKVRRMIEQTTGVQTIQQMLHLVELVKSGGLVPAADVHDAAGYKACYNERLMRTVSERTRRFAAGERDRNDFTVKGAIELLVALRERGLRLYLASGTDEEDVRQEAAILGYAACFEGRIFGSRGSEIGDAKRAVIGRILAEAAGPGEALLVIGDGPVEIREGRRVGALCVGVAADEIRRHGLDPAKRKRLIRAGADLIVEDFAQRAALFAAIGV